MNPQNEDVGEMSIDILESSHFCISQPTQQNFYP